MKRFSIIFLTILFVIIQVAGAQVIREMNTSIDLTTQNKANIEMTFRIPDKVNEISLPIQGAISDIKTTNGDCNVLSDVQQILHCKPEFPNLKGEVVMTVSFVANNLIKTEKNITSFSFDLSIAQTTDKINIITRLPLGMALSDKIVIPVSPSDSEVGSDGRRIFIKWHFTSKYYEDIIPIRVYYESTTSTPREPEITFLIIIFSALIAIIFILYVRVRKKKTGLVLSVLNEAERIIVEIIQNQQEEEVDQRKIVALAGFSKAKVSRIISSLEERGVVESTHIGRKNKIVLKKKFIKEETEQSQKENIDK